VTLRLQVSDLLSRPGHSREDTAFLRLCFQVGDASIDDEVAVEVRLRSLTDGVVARGTAATTVDLVCTRCLTTWSEPLSATFEAVFRLHPEDADDEFGIEEGGWIDLEPIVHDEVSLSVPAVPLCRPDCAGLCQTCGTDLNTAPCGGHGDESVSPFAALKQLFEP
jgi:uncharacterized protein